MKIADILSENRVLAGMTAADGAEALRCLSEFLASTTPHLDPERVYQILSDLTQESRLEVALPHATEDWVRLEPKEAR